MTRLMIRRVIAITIGWVVVGAVLAVYDHLSYLTLQENALAYGFASSLAASMLGGLLGGLLGGAVIVFYLKRIAAERSFPAALVSHTLVVSGVIVVVMFLVSLTFQAVQTGGWPNAQSVREVLGYMSGPAGMKVLLFWFVIVALTSLLLEVSDKYGPSVLRDFVLGRYHRPKVEQRCFMFLDMRSSTTIAEALGHERYFDLLRSCFRDMTKPIVESSGEIYQYVGDEVVLTWPLEKGVTNGNCVRCFHRIRHALVDHSAFYAKEFGVQPEFKAGLHSGEVTTGEVGTIRKDIVFTGDVLNTAARIQERCNPLGHDLLLSGELMSRLPEDFGRGAIELEQASLRGRSEPVTIHTYQSPPGGT